MSNSDPRVTDASDVLKNATDNPSAPIVYFDLVPAHAGTTILNIPLACVHLSIEDGVVKPQQVIVAHLRCGRDAAATLRKTLDHLLSADEPPPGAAN